MYAFDEAIYLQYFNFSLRYSYLTAELLLTIDQRFGTSKSCQKSLQGPPTPMKHRKLHNRLGLAMLLKD